MAETWQQRAARNYERIRQFYIDKGHTQTQWLAVSADVHNFNRVWRAMLRLPAGDMPPPEALR